MVAKLDEIYQQLLFIRQMELKTAEIYPSDKIKSPVHLSIGQEFVSVGVCMALRDTDYVAATYRGHAAYLAKGGDPGQLIAEMYGKAGGCAKGRGGSMHLIEPNTRVIGTSAIVGTGVPVATGYALAQKQQGTEDVVVCFLGDGATEEGCFYESLNFAGLHQLPILFVVENNRFAIHEPLEKRWADLSLASRVSGFNLAYRYHGDGDVMTLLDTSCQMIDAIRHGHGPALLEVDCYRWYQHVGPDQDFAQGYRSEQDWHGYRERDPVTVLAAELSAEQKQSIDELVEKRVEQAFVFAESSPFPTADEVFQYVYK